VVVPAGVVNFGAPETVPAKYDGRTFYHHNPLVTLMRTTREENAALGAIVAGKLNKASGPTIFMIPRRGVSSIDVEGKPFYDPAADAAFFQAVKADLAGHVRVVEMDTDINDERFAVEAARLLIEALAESRLRGGDPR